MKRQLVFAIYCVACAVHANGGEVVSRVNGGLRSNQTTAFQKEIDELSAAGGGTLRIPAGEYVVSSLRIREHYADRAFMKDVVPVQGHSVFKVAAGGKTFEAFVLTNEDETMRVLYRRRFDSGNC